MEILNAKIDYTMLGIEDHGIMSFMIGLTFDGSGQGFGGYALDTWVESKKCRVGTAYGLDAIMQVMKVVGVSKWEDLKDKYVRVKKESFTSPITSIGHIIENKWYDIEEHAQSWRTF